MTISITAQAPFCHSPVRAIAKTQQSNQPLKTEIDDDGFKKHFLLESDNTTMFVEHMQAKDVSTSRYKVVFKPSSIVPDVDIK